jgi:drug/metabolite transporter (DMT)-like permease
MRDLWVIFALTSAFAVATSDALVKNALREDGNEYLVAWFRLLFSLPLLGIIWFFVSVPKLDPVFYKAFFILLPVELVTVILYVKALKLSPLSLTLPFLALTPVFLIVISYITLGERVSISGAAGIMLLASGAYLLNLRAAKKGIFEPFKAIGREKGSLIMIAVAFLYSLTSSLGKLAIEHSSPLFFGTTYFFSLCICLTPVALFMGRHELKSFAKKKRYKSLVLPGFFYSVMIVTHMMAISLTKVAYMISVKRISLLIGVLYGYFFFREEDIKMRFSGALLMAAGFVLIVTDR